MRKIQNKYNRKHDSKFNFNIDKKKKKQFIVKPKMKSQRKLNAIYEGPYEVIEIHYLTFLLD